MSTLPLLPAPRELELVSFAADKTGAEIHLRTRRRSVACPVCGNPTDRVHSRYSRTLSDLPWHGSVVKIRLETRRFFCSAPKCPRRIFAERLPETAEHYARRTLRLAAALDAVALALGSEAGARLAGSLGMGISSDTMLRRLHSGAPARPATSPRVLGVDDWAFRKGQSYGTILVDLERRRPVDLLPDRTADTLAPWLAQRPSVEIIARDRSSEYARAIQQAAPHVHEVADRWHLLHNLRQVLERFFIGRHARQKRLLGSVLETLPPLSEWMPRRRSRPEEATLAAGRQRRLAHYEAVRRLRAEEGLNILQIAQRLGISRITVRKYLSAAPFPEHSPHPPLPRLLRPYEVHLERRWREGCRNALELWREIRALGYRGSSRPVHHWASPRRETAARNTPHVHRDRPTPPWMKRTSFPAPRRLSWLLLRNSAELTGSEAATLEYIQRDPEVAVAHGLARRFVSMIKHQESKHLDLWLAACAESGISWLATFSEGLAKDYDAVRVALELPWSSAQAEGQINRLKLLKRQMYGRASFRLLRSRVLRAA